MTRRKFGAGILGSSYAAVRSGQGAQSGAAIDQNPIRRRGIGLRGVNSARASAGLTLFAPITGSGTLYLIDLNGKIVHTWQMPYAPGVYGYLTERGTLFYNGKIPNATFLGKDAIKRWRSVETGLERSNSLGGTPTKSPPRWTVAKKR